MEVVHKQWIVDTIQHLHVAGDLAYFSHDGTNGTLTLRIEASQHLLIRFETVEIFNQKALITDLQSHRTMHKWQLNPQLLEHREDDARVLDGTNALVVDKPIAFKGVYQASQTFLLFTKQHGKARACTVGSCSQTCHASTDNHHIIVFYIHGNPFVYTQGTCIDTDLFEQIPLTGSSSGGNASSHNLGCCFFQQ
ncbi:hypothetical protein SDC9_102504 [bioreactor metagenome]|uniref:Uncharacterized protein n=1 Tax=bioreactor metagenome TaxID=1076179 RepID=A0A645ARM4_9ZZZZ